MTLPKFIKPNPLFWAMFVPAVIDGSLTLIGQNPAYWTNYNLVNEGSPVWIILATHPLLFIAGSVLWFVIWYWIYRKLPHPLNLMLTIAFIAGHTWGSASWLTKSLNQAGLYSSVNRIGWFILILYFIFIGVACGTLINYYQAGRKK